MRRPIFKKLLKTAGAILLVMTLLMLLPRTWSALNPSKPPAGYFFRIPTYLAIFTGLEKMIDKNPPLPLNVEEISNIEYKNVGGKSLQLDIYKPAQMKEAAPMLVFIHGGGWKGGKRSDYRIYLTHFARLGYVCATVSYRLKGDALYPACVEDIGDVVHWIFTHSHTYGYDTARVALVGGSAGAHLSMLSGYGWKNTTGTIEPFNESGTGRIKHKIKAVVEIYGPTDLTTEYARNHPLVTGFMGHTFEERPDLYREASPVTWVSEEAPPTLILQGTSDTLVPLSQAELLRDKLIASGVPCVYYALPGWPHTMDIAIRVNNYVKKVMEDFFRSYLL